MTDQAYRTVWALQQFMGFVNSYTPPAMQVHCRDEIEHVKKAIRAIAPAPRRRSSATGCTPNGPTVTVIAGLSTSPSALCRRRWRVRRTCSTAR